MSSRSGELISLALQKSLPSNCKKAKTSTIDDCIGTAARRVLSTKIEYVHCPEYSTSEFLKSLKSKYTVLKPNKPKKKKKKKNKLKNSENFVSIQSSMKNTELNGQNLSLPTPKSVLFSPDDVQLGWKSSVPVGSGFINLGTTCYINSTLQALFHVPSFANWLKDDKKHEASCEKMNGMLHTECIVCAMSKTLQLSHRANGSNIRPKYIIEKVKTICKHLSPFRQEDAHEFLRYLMEAMEKSYTAALGMPIKKLDSYSKETTPLNQIFGGYIRTEVTCLECSHVSTTFQHFQDLILDIRQNNTTTVYDALESYFSKERLDGDESYHCEHCKKKVSADKKFSIERAPNALCIQLKRFNINSFYGGSKISKLISTPQTIDLTKFKHRKGPSGSLTLKYRLVSMVFHHGPSANSGHYTALGCTSSGSYYYFNDEQVCPVHLGNYTNNPNAYIIFYELEKPNLINENSMNVMKSSVSSTVIPLSNGCVNGAVQPRINGFLSKRENPFSTSNHSKNVIVARDSSASVLKEANSQRPVYRQPSWELVSNKENNLQQSVNSVAKPAAVVELTTSSLVPYTQSSDSESSDVEPDKKSNDSNNNPRSTLAPEDKNPVSGTSVLSPLAKKNSTLTSLLTSSPKNENVVYRLSNPPRPLNSCKPVDGNGQKESTALQNGNGDLKSFEKRDMISFSLSGRDRKKFESPYKNGEEEKCTSMKEMASVSSYFSNTNGNDHVNSNGESVKKEVNGNQDCPSLSGEELSSYLHPSRENGLTNGVTKTNGMVNGNGVTTTNGWVVTSMEDECGENTERNHCSKSLNGEWTVTKENRKSLSVKESLKLKEGWKCNANSNGSENESRNGNSSPQNDSQNRTNNYPYSSQNGYGGKVLTWNGGLSSINKECEQERKELSKRNYNYDENIDRGKIKKARYHSRENGSISQSPRKNLIQQHHNQYNNGYSNNNRNRRWKFSQNGFQFNNRRPPPPHNAHFRNNNYYSHRTSNNYTNSNDWRR